MGDEDEASKEGYTLLGDYEFPPGADPDPELLYTIPFGSSEVKDLKWEGYIDVAHNLGAAEVQTDLVDSGVGPDGIQYAVVKTTIVTEDGREFSSLGSADETTNQVRDPEFTWLVAESRSVKRTVKKAFNIKPHRKEASDEPVPSDSQSRGPSPPDDVEFEDGHALSDAYEDEQPTEDRGIDEDVGGDW